MRSQGGPFGTLGPWGPLGLGDPLALGDPGPWGPMGPWGPIGLWGPMGPWGQGTYGLTLIFRIEVPSFKAPGPKIPNAHTPTAKGVGGRREE